MSYPITFPTCPPPPVPSYPPPGMDSSSYHLLIVQQNGVNLRSVPEEHQTFEIVQLAVEQDGMNLKFAADQWKNHEEIIAIAYAENPESLQYASARLSRCFKDLYLDR